jgi:hypothetical protein
MVEESGSFLEGKNRNENSNIEKLQTPSHPYITQREKAPNNLQDCRQAFVHALEQACFHRRNPIAILADSLLAERASFVSRCRRHPAVGHGSSLKGSAPYC